MALPILPHLGEEAPKDQVSWPLECWTGAGSAGLGKSVSPRQGSKVSPGPAHTSVLFKPSVDKTDMAWEGDVKMDSLEQMPCRAIPEKCSAWKFPPRRARGLNLGVPRRWFLIAASSLI